MKIGKDHFGEEHACLNCGKLLDGATGVMNDDDPRNDIKPTPGSITICIECGHIMAFKNGGGFRNLSNSEMLDIAGDSRILAISKAIDFARNNKSH